MGSACQRSVRPLRPPLDSAAGGPPAAAGAPTPAGAKVERCSDDSTAATAACYPSSDVPCWFCCAGVVCRLPSRPPPPPCWQLGSCPLPAYFHPAAWPGGTARKARVDQRANARESGLQDAVGGREEAEQRSDRVATSGSSRSPVQGAQRALELLFFYRPSLSSPLSLLLPIAVR